MSQSEREMGPELMRAYYQQQLDWQAGVINRMNHVSFRSKSDRAGLASLTGREFERLLNLDGVGPATPDRVPAQSVTPTISSSRFGLARLSQLEGDFIFF